MDHSPVPSASWRNAPSTLGGEQLVDLLEAHRWAMVEAMLHEVRTQLPSYARMPSSEFDDWVSVICHRLVDYYVSGLRHRELPSTDMLLPVRDTAARRAAAGVPMDEVMSAFYIGAAVVTDEMARRAGPGDTAAVIAIQAFGFDFLRLIASVVAAGYTMERQSILGEELATRQTLVADLLAGTATDESALRAGTRLSPAYVIVAFSLTERGRVEDEGAVRQAIRRIRLEAARIGDEPVLWASPRSGWLAFVPYPSGPEGFSTDDRVWLALTHREVQAVVDLPIYTGWAVAAPPGVPEAARLARDVCDVVLATRRPPGIYELDDVLIDYQLMRPGPARDRLDRMLRPLDQRPELLLTLRTYMETGRDRRRTAERLHLHPNSVDNRLRRCADLTGLDATEPEEAILIRAALLT
jgi:hypothetical protein